MPLVHPCSEPGCSTLTMGCYCLAHELEPDARPDVRGRRLAVAAAAGALAGLAAAVLARARLPV